MICAYKVYHRVSDVLDTSSSYSVVGLEWASPGVGGGIVFPLSVSVGFALELLLSDVLIGVSLGLLLLKRSSGDGSNKGEDDGEFHDCCKNNYNISITRKLLSLPFR